jgi:hypothetical protein
LSNSKNTERPEGCAAPRAELELRLALDERPVTRLSERAVAVGEDELLAVSLPGVVAALSGCDWVAQPPAIASASGMQNWSMRFFMGISLLSI